MGSAEIITQKKEIQERLSLRANIATGELTNARAAYLEEMAELQKQCSHYWDTGEEAIVPIGEKTYLCPICQKNIKI